MVGGLSSGCAAVCKIVVVPPVPVLSVALRSQHCYLDTVLYNKLRVRSVPLYLFDSRTVMCGVAAPAARAPVLL